ncbi:TonB-dependent receptor [Noviherbaspirillum sp. ST9]|uniref:TonB-dependent receptor n=1 Tax=Noviherbaspirillum sp. ST9 TaxID=3401606 RepID=UPI003B587FB9
MTMQAALVASAVLPALAAFPLSALAQDKCLPEVVVTATPFGNSESSQLLTPARVLSGTELRNKLGASLGDVLSSEPGVTASGFGAGASRPIIRGLEGPRVKILQNGMTVSDLSALSNDHAVASETATARQIEVLRGPAALLYGSGAIGGVINVVNDRIPTELLPSPSGMAETRAGYGNRERSASFSADGASGSIALHLDGSARNTGDYRIPGFAARDDASSASGRLPSSFTRARDVGFGASHVANWGYIGASVANREDRYGIPTEEKSFIDLQQTRLDGDAMILRPFDLAESVRVRAGATDYKHTEKEQDGTPAANFSNKAVETRWELAHRALGGWRGTLGLHSEHSRFAALSAETGRPDTVPVTRSSSLAAYLVEERDFGPVRGSAGVRLESVKRNPDAASAPDRRFDLLSYSVGGAWTFIPGYSLGGIVSIAQRAPNAEELYSNGPHEATGTVDIGDAALQKERSRNLELALQKTQGSVRWKLNLFENKARDFIYGRLDGATVDADGLDNPDGQFTRRFWAQERATIRGAEAEWSINLRGEGPSLRMFADTSRGKLDTAGHLPLQPATRAGIDAGYRRGPLQAGASVMRVRAQERLAVFEALATPGYTQLDAHLSYSVRDGAMNWTWFILAKNLLDKDIRLSTSLLRNVAPQPGRNVVVGIRTQF